MTSERRRTTASQRSDDLEITRHDAYVEFEFTGEFSPAAAMKVVDVMVAACVEADCPNALLDCRHMRGPLSVVDRFTVAEYGAQAIHRHIRVAMLAREEHILPDHFFENVAVNRGVRVKVFTDADEAVGWLAAGGLRAGRATTSRRRESRPPPAIRKR